MALIFCDGMDHYTSAQVSNKWDAGSVMGYTTTGGRFNGGCQTGSGFTFNAASLKNITVGNSFIVGFALKVLTYTSSTVPFVRFYDGATAQCEIRMDSTGHIGVYTNNVLLGSVSVNSMSLNIWYFVEWKVTIAASVGTNQCVVHVNNVEWLNLTGVSTKTSSNAQATTVGIGRFGSDSSGFVFDDFYICNNSGTTNNDFLGDCRIETLYPNGVGTNTDFTLNGASSNWQAVSETHADDDTSYVSSDTPGAIDNYTFSDPAGTINTVFAIQTVMRAKKDNAGVRTFSRIVSIGGTNYTGISFALGTDYNFYAEVIETNPSTSSPWSSADILALEAGVKVIS